MIVTTVSPTRSKKVSSKVLVMAEVGDEGGGW